MHLIMIVIALCLAWGLRLIPLTSQGTWENRWHKSLFSFLVSPLILVTTALAIFLMGTEGSMLGLPASGLSYGLAVTFLVITLIFWFKITRSRDENLSRNQSIS